MKIWNPGGWNAGSLILRMFFHPFLCSSWNPHMNQRDFFGIPHIKTRGVKRWASYVFNMGPEGVFSFEGLRVFFQSDQFPILWGDSSHLPQIKCILVAGYPWVVRSTGWSWMTVQRLEIGLWNYWCKNPAKQLRLGSLSHYPKVLYIPTVFPFTGSVEGDKTGTPERY